MVPSARGTSVYFIAIRRLTKFPSENFVFFCLRWMLSSSSQLELPWANRREP